MSPADGYVINFQLCDPVTPKLPCILSCVKMQCLIVHS